MEKTKCPFCGSPKIRIDTPFIDPISGETQTTFCCKQQEQNHRYIEKHTDPLSGEKPNWEDVAKNDR